MAGRRNEAISVIRPAARLFHRTSGLHSPGREILTGHFEKPSDGPMRADSFLYPAARIHAHEIGYRRSQDRSNAMTMDAWLPSRSPGVYLQPVQLRANIEFGVDPAIEADGARHASFDRRRVSLRWLSGTLLTGLSGAALIGSAIYAALGHQTYFAEAPTPALSQRKEINLDFGVNPHKGDRLVKAVDIVAGKQSFRAPTTLRIGDKEVVKVHEFTHVQT
ncbi:MAG: hypothetical protein ACREDJ_10315, partial [Methylocella sp.]